MRRTTELGRLAQWLEHLVYTQGVGGSKPSAPNGVTQTSALTECTKTRMRNPPEQREGSQATLCRATSGAIHLVPCGGFCHAEDLVPKRQVSLVSHCQGKREAKTDSDRKS